MKNNELMNRRRFFKKAAKGMPSMFGSFVVSFILCVCGLTVHAQESSLPSGFTTGDNVWIVRAGLGFNNVSGSGVLDTKASWAATSGAGEFENALGGNISLGLYCPLGSGPLYFGFNVGAGMRGYKTSAKWQKGIYSLYSQETTLTAFNFQISPSNIGYIVKINEKTALDFHVGLFFTYDFTGSIETENEYPNKSTESNSINIKDNDNYEKYDVGVVGGIGLWMSRWNIELNYQRGLATIDKGGKNLYSNRLLFSLGYAF